MNTKDNQEAEREAFEKLIIPVLNNLPISGTKYQYALNSIKTAFDMMTTLTTPQVNEEVASGEHLSETEIETKLVISVEKLLCEKLGKQWSASGISIVSLIDELANKATPSPSNVLVEALREITYSHDGYARKKAEQALATYSASTDSVSINTSEYENYHELIMAVASKYPNETRHETALRYIKERENKQTTSAQSIDIARKSS